MSRFGPCMCGDIRCNSCGPAQGNSHCLQCGMWADEGGCAEPEKCAALEVAYVEAMAKEYEEMDKLGDEYWNRIYADEPKQETPEE